MGGTALNSSPGKVSRIKVKQSSYLAKTEKLNGRSDIAEKRRTRLL